MWGNRIGWGISAVIVLLTAMILFYVEYLSRDIPEPEKFGRDKKYLAELKLPVDPRSLASWMTEGTDAGDLCRQAIAEYKARETQYENWRDKPATMGITSPIKGIDLILQASRCSKLELFSRDVTEVVNYKWPKEPIHALERLGTLAGMRGSMFRNAGKHAEARQHYEALFSLGLKLYEERVVYEEMRTGFGMMGTGARGLIDLAEKDPGLRIPVKTYQDFYQAYREYDQGIVQPLNRVISSIDPKTVARHPGDIFRLASSAQKERMWRVEAVLKLGRMRYYVGEGGSGRDQRSANRVLKRMAIVEADPVVRTAAIAGRDLTEIEYNQLGRMQ